MKKEEPFRPKCVITTINAPTKQVREWAKIFRGNTIIIGDEKTPDNWSCDGADYFSPCGQEILGYSRLHSPNNHYARKNIGYLIAMKQGASLILETDDDNAPRDNFRVRNQIIHATRKTIGKGWCNAYRHFTNENQIWPRGLPLNKIAFDDIELSRFGHESSSPIQQGLACGNPDVDAIWRLINPKSVMFENGLSIELTSGSWCPFNSQSTWWWPEAYGLMYLPINATFRMTDIWRSFVAQRCLWELGKGVVFHSPAEVFQERNPHDLMKDFESEVPGYLHNEAIATMLGKLRLKKGQKNVLENLRKCYEGMVSGGFLPQLELKSVDAWIDDVKEIQENK